VPAASRPPLPQPSPREERERPPRPFGRAQGRRLGARTYLVGALFLFVIPGIAGGAVWWLTATKAAVDRAFREPLREFKGPRSAVEAVAFGPDGRRALSGSHDGTVRLWEIGTGTEIRVFKGHTDMVESVVFAPDGRRALSGSCDHTVRLWDVETGAMIREFRGHAGGVWSVAFGPNGRRALSGGRDGMVRLWDLETGKLIRGF